MSILKVFTLTETSPSSATTAAGATALTAGGLREFDWFTVDATLSAVTTNGTLDVYLQRDVDGVWVDWIHFAQLASGATLRVCIDSKQTEAGPVTVGSGTSPALAAGKFAVSHPGDKIRMLFTAGSGTNAGASNTVKITCHKSR